MLDRSLREVLVAQANIAAGRRQVSDAALQTWLRDPSPLVRTMAQAEVERRSREQR